MNRLILLLSLVLSCNGIAFGASLTAREIMEKNEAARKLPQCEAHAKLVTQGASGPEKVKDFTWWRKLSPDQKFSNTLTRFHFPPEVKGEGILFLEHGNGNNDVQLYLPNFKKIRRVETDQQSSSFMGSEFSYSDIVEPHLDDFNYKLLREENCPSTTTLKCFVIQATPISESVKTQTGSASGTTWIRSDNFMVSHAEYQDSDGEPWKSLDASMLQEVEPNQHKWMAMKLKMLSLKTKHTTEITFDQVKVDKPLASSLFTPQNLQRE